MPTVTPAIKINSVKRLGAEVHTESESSHTTLLRRLGGGTERTYGIERGRMVLSGVPCDPVRCVRGAVLSGRMLLPGCTGRRAV
eukprot:1317828-Rhodomonas_salina.3